MSLCGTENKMVWGKREREERNGLGNVKVRHILLSAIFILRTVRKTSKGSFNYLN